MKIGIYRSNSGATFRLIMKIQPPKKMYWSQELQVTDNEKLERSSMIFVPQSSNGELKLIGIEEVKDG